ncbi:MAG: acylphosphatase [Anaerolineales bacterium]|nr:acylphosphatase [Anaerolineales bacterium]
MEIVQAHVWISGTVQGVGYRYHAEMKALSLELTGWIRNLYDGRVEAVFCGSKCNVETMLAWCQKGSSNARVERIDVRWEAAGNDDDFIIRMTACGEV